MTARCRVHPDHLLLSIASINPDREGSIILGDSSIALSVPSLPLYMVVTSFSMRAPGFRSLGFYLYTFTAL